MSAPASAMRRMFGPIVAVAVAAVSEGVAADAPGTGAGAADGVPRFDLPIDCEPGRTCWIVNYVDHDPTAGVRDYACGAATYNDQPGNRHKGTDFSIGNLGAMRRGVAVLAAAAGVVTGVREGMADVNFRQTDAKTLKGRECGNGVMLTHDGGWQTQYCHMRGGSIAVKKGDRVAAGQRLGVVGLSGRTEFPHVHFQVMKDGADVDPFTGPGSAAGCGPRPDTLWKPEVLARLPYRPTAVYAAGFADGPPDPERVRDGAYRNEQLSSGVAALVLWADIYWVRRGDQVAFTVTAPNGRTIMNQTQGVGADKALRLVFADLRRKEGAWPEGTYRGEVTLTRRGGPGADLKLTVSRQVRVVP